MSSDHFTVRGPMHEQAAHEQATDIRRLLAERPSVAGVAVPGTPADRYDVLSFDRSGSTAVFTSH